MKVVSTHARRLKFVLFLLVILSVIGMISPMVASAAPRRAVSSECVGVPEGSVMGKLMSVSAVYWAPGQISPGLELSPGNKRRPKTYWVVGTDTTGEYYQIILGCQYIWVPKGVMAPDYLDPMWQGWKLPTRVVDGF